MKFKYFKLFFFLLTLFAISIPAYSQFSYYIRMEEVEIRGLLSVRKIAGLGVQYTNDGKKLMTWQDIELQTGVVVIFDGMGKSESCTLIPFTPKDLYEFKVVFSKNHQVIGTTEWISTLGNRKFKILMQYNSTYTKYCFFITEISKLDELIKRLKPSVVRQPGGY